jgi:hypothetical protein
MTDASHAQRVTAVFSVSTVEAAAFITLVVIALIVIGVLFAVFLHLDDRTV